MGVSKIFSTQEKDRLKKAIQTAENNTSGEIRIHVENNCKTQVLDRAAEVFAQLKMHKTQLRNGILFYLSVKDRKFAIIGDMGINAKVPENFWDEIKEIAISHFKDGDFASGLEKGILKAGEQLKAFFPLQDDDENELSDDISFENN